MKNKMSFTSLSFWAFFAGIFTIYWLVREKRWQNIILLVASYTFYGWVQPWLGLMLVVSTLARLELMVLSRMRCALRAEALTCKLVKISI